MPKYQSEFPQYVIPSPEENKIIEVDVTHSSRLLQLQEKNERLRKDLAIYSRKTYELQIQNAKLLDQNRQLKKKWLREACIVGTLACLVIIIDTLN
jgi:hypothetical protein